MTDDNFRKLLEERGWSIYRGGNQIVLSKGDYRITLKPSLDVPGKVLMLKGFLSNEAGPKYEFFDSKDVAFRDVERFIRQQSKPEISSVYPRSKPGVSFDELLEEAVQNSPDVSMLPRGREEMEAVVNYVYTSYPGAHNISWDGYALRFEGINGSQTIQSRSMLELEGVL